MRPTFRLPIPIIAGVLMVVLPAVGGCAPTVMRGGSEAVEPVLVAAPVAVMDDGVRLPLRVFRPAGEPVAGVVALHGFGDYSNAFADLGPALAEAGIVVWAPDQRGFGRGPGRRYWHGAERMARDAETLVRLAKAELPGRPVYLLGESMGGAVALVALAAPDSAADGAVLSAPAVWGRDWMPPPQDWGLEILAHTMPWLPLEPRGIRVKPTDNVAVLKALAKDPLFIKRPRVDAVHGLVGLMDAAQHAAPDIRRPLLVLYGARDDLIPRRPTCGLLAALPADQTRVALYANGFHMLFRDLNGAAVTGDIAAWTADQTAALPSGEEAVDGDRSAFCAAG